MNTTNTKGAIVALAPMPEPAMRAAPVGNEMWPFPKVGYYTAEQMQDYARAALQAHSPPAPAELDAVIRAAVWDSAEVVHPGRLASETAAGAVTDAMVSAYLEANTRYWHHTDTLPTPPDKWRAGTPRDATRVSLIAAFSAATPPAATKVPSDEHVLRALDTYYQHTRGAYGYSDVLISRMRDVLAASPAAHGATTSEPAQTLEDAARYRWLRHRKKAMSRAIAQEERACRAEDALIDLVNQIRKTSPVDDHGHKLTMNMAYLNAMKLLDSVRESGA